MSTSGWKSLLCTLPLCLAITGCHRRPAPPPPPAPAPQSQPPLTPSNITVITPLPSVPPTAEPNVQPAAAAAPPPKPKPTKSRRRSRRPGKSKPTETATQSPQATSTATTGPAATTSAADSKQSATPSTPTVIGPGGDAAAPIPTLSGQWSTGTAISTAQRTKMMAAIDAQEKRIPTVPNPTATDTAAILTQVKSFLAKAREAVANNDLDGAQTLNMKAQVLLDELLKGS